MSTTVTYKGTTLTTAINQTRILETAGKYMEDDVTIVDVSTEATDGDLLSYGDITSSLAGVGKVGAMILSTEYINPIVNIGQSDYIILIE